VRTSARKLLLLLLLACIGMGKSEGHRAGGRPAAVTGVCKVQLQRSRRFHNSVLTIITILQKQHLMNSRQLVLSHQLASKMACRLFPSNCSAEVQNDSLKDIDCI
jgi:hypothetical protein